MLPRYGIRPENPLGAFSAGGKLRIYVVGASLFVIFIYLGMFSGSSTATELKEKTIQNLILQGKLDAMQISMMETENSLRGEVTNYKGRYEKALDSLEQEKERAAQFQVALETYKQETGKRLAECDEITMLTRGSPLEAGSAETQQLSIAMNAANTKAELCQVQLAKEKSNIMSLQLDLDMCISQLVEVTSIYSSENNSTSSSDSGSDSSFSLSTSESDSSTNLSTSDSDSSENRTVYDSSLTLLNTSTNSHVPIIDSIDIKVVFPLCTRENDPIIHIQDMVATISEALMYMSPNAVSLYVVDFCQSSEYFEDTMASLNDVLEATEVTIDVLPFSKETEPDVRTTDHEGKNWLNGGHVRWILQTMMADAHTQRVAIVQPNLIVSADFFTFLKFGGHLMEEDPTIFSVSAWNEHSYPIFALSDTELLRTDFFSGVAWMTHRRTWEELGLLEWPEQNWQQWVQEVMQTSGKHVLVPEYSRVELLEADIDSEDVLIPYGQMVELFDGTTDFELHDAILSMRLAPSTYNSHLMADVKKAKEVSLEDFAELYMDDDVYSKQLLKIGYTDEQSYSRIANIIGVDPTFAGVTPRQSYSGIVRFRFGAIRLYVVPAELL